MNKKELFKDFLKRNPYLFKSVLEEKTTYQKLFEIYDIYGEDSNIWKEYNKTTNQSIKGILSNLKNIDIDKLEDNISSLEKALSFLEEIMSIRQDKTTSKKTTKKDSEIERFFDD